MKSRFLGKVKKKTYYHSYGTKIKEDLEVIRYKTIFEFDLKVPPLEEYDDFYIAEIDDWVHLEKAMRGIDENNQEIMIYIVDRTLEVIEDEETENSLAKAQLDVENYLKEEREEKLLREAQKKENDKKWYQFWK